MRKRDELSDPNSCMSRARDDEWTFVLLGRDVAACAAVRAWVVARVAFGKNTLDDLQILEAKRWIAEVTAEQEAATKKPSAFPEKYHSGMLPLTALEQLIQFYGSRNYNTGDNKFFKGVSEVAKAEAIELNQLRERVKALEDKNAKA